MERQQELSIGRSQAAGEGPLASLEHVKPLLVEDAPRSRFLITTRDATIASELTERNFSADLLSDAEARELLARAAKMEAIALPPEANEIIHECSGLAAAISQIGGSLKAAEEWRDTLEALKRADISEIEERLPTGQTSFFKSLEVSVQVLPEQMQDRYQSLAVLLEDVPAPIVVLQTLWKANEQKARHTARYFVDRALASWQDPTDPARGIRLHDLQLDYVRARVDDQVALPLIHGALQLSANVIARKPEEFASQMVGRLLPYEGMGAVAKFTKDVAEGGPRPWLRPLWPSLHPPGTSLIRTLAGHRLSVKAVAVTADGRRAVSASADHTLMVWDLASGAVLAGLPATMRVEVVFSSGRMRSWPATRPGASICCGWRRRRRAEAYPLLLRDARSTFRKRPVSFYDSHD